MTKSRLWSRTCALSRSSNLAGDGWLGAEFPSGARPVRRLTTKMRPLAMAVAILEPCPGLGPVCGPKLKLALSRARNAKIIANEVEQQLTVTVKLIPEK
jgi:hypothetical protein